MDQAIVVEEKAFGSCFETEDQKAGMGNFLEKDKAKKLKVINKLLTIYTHTNVNYSPLISFIRFSIFFLKFISFSISLDIFS